MSQEIATQTPPRPRSGRRYAALAFVVVFTAQVLTACAKSSGDNMMADRVIQAPPVTSDVSGSSGSSGVSGATGGTAKASGAGAPAPSGPAATVPAATVPTALGSTEPTKGIDGAALAKSVGPSVYSVLSRSCTTGDYFVGSGFAVDPRFLVTLRSVVAEVGTDPNSEVDPAPWIRSSTGTWRRTRVVSESKATGLVLLEVMNDYTELPETLKWGATAPAPAEIGAMVGYPGAEDGQERVLAVNFDGTKVGENPDATPGGGLGFKMLAATESGSGLLGAPLTNAAGAVVGVVTQVNKEKAIGNGLPAADASVATVQMSAKRAALAGRCGADDKARLALAWGVVLDANGATAKAEALSAVPSLGALGRISSIDRRWVRFFPAESVGPVVLGPFGSESAASDALDEVRDAFEDRNLPAPVGLSMFPVAAYEPEPTPPAYTTMTMPPPTPPTTTTIRKRVTTTTTAPKGNRTTTTAKGSTGTCPPAGKRRLAKIVNGGSGMSVIFRASPSATGTGVAKAANGYQVSVVSGSSTNGFSMVVLPESPPRCAWVPNGNLG